jgi:hypothetical protein
LSQKSSNLNEIGQLLTSYNIDDDRFTKACSRMVELLSNAREYWRGSNNNEKRALLNFVFSNLETKGASLCYTLRKLFASFMGGTDRPEWRVAATLFQTVLYYLPYKTTSYFLEI